jgi:hypothetical protein
VTPNVDGRQRTRPRRKRLTRILGAALLVGILVNVGSWRGITSAQTKIGPVKAGFTPPPKRKHSVATDPKKETCPPVNAKGEKLKPVDPLDQNIYGHTGADGKPDPNEKDYFMGRATYYDKDTKRDLIVTLWCISRAPKIAADKTALAQDFFAYTFQTSLDGVEVTRIQPAIANEKDKLDHQKDEF